MVPVPVKFRTPGSWGLIDCPALHDTFRTFPFESEEAGAFLASGGTYKIDLESFGRTVSLEQRVDRFESLDYVPFRYGTYLP